MKDQRFIIYWFNFNKIDFLNISSSGKPEMFISLPIALFIQLHNLISGQLNGIKIINVMSGRPWV